MTPKVLGAKAKAKRGAAFPKGRVVKAKAAAPLKAKAKAGAQPTYWACWWFGIGCCCAWLWSTFAASPSIRPSL
eukprot:2319088-Amphidinium_carterae.1